MPNPEHLPIQVRLMSNGGAPLVNKELQPFKNLATRSERRAALRGYKKKIKKHMQNKVKHGLLAAPELPVPTA